MSQMYWEGEFKCLKIPVQNNIEATTITIENNNGFKCSGKIPLAKTRIDEWKILLMPWKGDILIRTSADAALDLIIPCENTESVYDEVYRDEQMIFHFFSEPEICELIHVKQGNHDLELFYTKNEGTPVYAKAFSEDMLTWQGGEIMAEENLNVTEIHTRKIQGDIKNLYTYKNLILGISEPFIWNGKRGNAFLLPLIKTGEEVFPATDMKKLRTWERVWKDKKIDNDFSAGLRFRIAPSTWPNIRILPPEGKEDDIFAEAYEIKVKIEIGTAKKINMDFCGISLNWDAEKNMLAWGKGAIPWNPDQGILSMHAYLDKKCGEFFIKDRVLYLNRYLNEEEKPVDNISGNLDNCVIASIPQNNIEIKTEDGTARLQELTVYGLRGLKYEPETQKIIEKMDRGNLLFQDQSFEIYDNRVTDRQYGKPDAYVPDKDTVISLVRAVEEFQWRDNGRGDMVRVLERKDVWHPPYEIQEYPELCTGIPVVDAAYRVALDTFCLCKSKEYALPGQEGMWSAGVFQGKGQGFGVWMRDSAHVALRCGSLIDPETARKTLLYTTKKGFDNGCDGAATVIVGIWDYYLVTDDISAVYEAWPALLENIKVIENRFDEKTGLVHAPQSTSNDAFPEPECAGYCLSTEVYSMKAFEAMAYLGRRLSYKKEKISTWDKYGKQMRISIQEKYWNAQYGFFTSGPKGSSSYEKGYWETSGEESVLWNKFHVADRKQKDSILEKLNDKAMTQFGVILFPDRIEKNHFCGSIWAVWEAGIAAASAEAGKYDLAYRLMFQQIRNCIINKTFYEVIDAESGLAWRWPAQLWHAAGFISILYYGILGISCDEKGMTFSPMLKKEWVGTKIGNLKYGKAVLQICFSGSGFFKEMQLDGIKVDRIPRNLQGEHQVEIFLDMS